MTSLTPSPPDLSLHFPHEPTEASEVFIPLSEVGDAIPTKHEKEITPDTPVSQEGEKSNEGITVVSADAAPGPDREFQSKLRQALASIPVIVKILENSHSLNHTRRSGDKSAQPAYPKANRSEGEVSILKKQIQDLTTRNERLRGTVWKLQGLLTTSPRKHNRTRGPAKRDGGRSIGIDTDAIRGVSTRKQVQKGAHIEQKDKLAPPRGTKSKLGHKGKDKSPGDNHSFSPSPPHITTVHSDTTRISPSIDLGRITALAIGLTEGQDPITIAGQLLDEMDHLCPETFHDDLDCSPESPEDWLDANGFGYIRSEAEDGGVVAGPSGLTIQKKEMDGRIDQMDEVLDITLVRLAVLEEDVKEIQHQGRMRQI